MNILRFRILLPILLLHLFALPLLLYQYMIHFEQPVWEALGQSMMAELQNRIAIHQLTGQYGQAKVQEAVDEFAQVYHFHSLRVYNPQGDLRALFGSKGPGPGRLDRVELLRIADEPVLEVTHWVPNSPSCRGCHPASLQHIGVIVASISVTDVAAKLGSQRQHAVVTAFATLLGVFGLISVFHYFLIVRPVKIISGALGRIKKGDLSVRVPIRREDELGLMARDINEMTAALAQARRATEEQHRIRMSRAEQLATVGEIAAGLAHEVKNPLAGISSALEVLLSETEPSWPHREVVQQIIEEAHRIAGIINRLLDYARPRKVNPDWYDLSMIATEIQGFFLPQCQKKKVRFTLQSAEHTGRMYVDVSELKQVIMNILLNALDAVGTGGEIRLDLRAEDSVIEFKIADNGPGMDPSVRERIFQPFFTTKTGGTGLGLAIVLRSVKEMGGELDVESQPGKGTTFIMELPRECYREAAHRG